MSEHEADTPVTMASFARQVSERHASRVAVRSKAGDSWSDTTYAELWPAVRELANGFVALGIEPGDRVCILSDTRPEWTALSLAVPAAGAVVVPIYPTNAPQECEWVVGNSQARAVVCENAEQAAKLAAVRDRLPDLEHVVLIDGDDSDTPTLDTLVTGGTDVDPAELNRRIGAVTPDDPFVIIYTSGTTGPPKGCVLSHRGFIFSADNTRRLDIVNADDVVYLFLPLAHVFAQLIQVCALEVGGAIAYYGGDTSRIIAELAEAQPTVLPSVPRIFEKVHAMAMGFLTPEQLESIDDLVSMALRVRDSRAAGEPVDAADDEAFATADDAMFVHLRALFGGRLRLAISGAAPIAADVLRFFAAAGITVLEGYGLTETTGVGTVNLPGAIRYGSVGRALPGVDVAIADDGEILLRGPVVFEGYWRDEAATDEVKDEDGWFHTGDLGSIDDDGFVQITGRKKEIIITAGGKNLAPANIEGDLRQSRWISQAVMYGDRRPYPVALITLDADTIVPWASAEGLPTDVAELAHEARVRDMIQVELDDANRRYAQVEQIKRFAILERDLTTEDGELTPTLKLKRNVVYDRYAGVIADLYG